MNEASVHAVDGRHRRNVPSWHGATVDGLSILAAAAVALWPALRCDYYADDFYFVAMSRTAASPLDFFLHGHFFTGYLYRPLPLALWWMVDRIAPVPAAHYALNGVLLAACGAALYLLARGYGCARALAIALALLFVWHPIGSITALWLSDIFDLTATALLLASLWGLTRYGQGAGWRWWWLALLLFAGACLSKELVYVGPAVFAVHVALRPRTRADSGDARAVRHRAGIGWPLRSDTITRNEWAFVGASALVVLAMLAVRRLVGVDTGLGETSEAMSHVVIAGMNNWFANLPRVVVHDRLAAQSGALVLASVVTLVTALAYFMRRRHVRAPGARAFQQLGVGSAIVLACTVVQSPHMFAYGPLLLGGDGGPSGYFYERFFFLAGAGLLLIVAAAAAAGDALRSTTSTASAHRGEIGSRTVAVVLAVGAAFAVQETHAVARIWERSTRSAAAPLLFADATAAALHAVAARGVRSSPCVLDFLGSDNTVFRFYAEPAIKALAHDARVDACIIRTEQPPTYSLAAPAAWPYYHRIAVQGHAPPPVYFGNWLMMRAGTYRVELPASAVPGRFAYCARVGRFLEEASDERC